MRSSLSSLKSRVNRIDTVPNRVAVEKSPRWSLGIVATFTSTVGSTLSTAAVHSSEEAGTSPFTILAMCIRFARAASSSCTARRSVIELVTTKVSLLK